MSTCKPTGASLGESLAEAHQAGWSKAIDTLIAGMYQALDRGETLESFLDDTGIPRSAVAYTQEREADFMNATQP